MNKKIKRTKREGESQVSKIFIKAQIICLLSYTLTFLLSSFFALTLDIGKQNLFYVCILPLAIASFLCAFHSAAKVGKNGLICGLLFNLPTNIFVIFISILFNSFSVDLTTVFSSLILFITSMLGGIFAVNQKQKPKIRLKRGIKK